MSVARYGNAPLPPPSPSHDVTPRSRAAALNVAFSTRPPASRVPVTYREPKREISPAARKPENPRAR